MTATLADIDRALAQLTARYDAATSAYARIVICWWQERLMRERAEILKKNKAATQLCRIHPG